MYQPRHHRLLSILLLVTLSAEMFGGVFTGAPKAEAAAGIFRPISYQGKVTTTGGSAITNGAYNMRFKIFNASSGGVAAWTETWDNTTTRVTMTGGLFSVLLGTHVTMTGSVNFNTDSLYLQVEFDPGNDGVYEETFSPRRRFASVPYAHNANTLDGIDSTQFVRKDQSEVMSGTLTVKPNDPTKVGIDIVSQAGTAATAALKLSTQGANHILFGTGGTTYDTNLYRSAVASLRTDGVFIVAGNMSGKSLTIMSGNPSYILGDVGIGKSGTPKAKLDVAGTISGSQLRISSGGISASGGLIAHGTIRFRSLTGCLALQSDSNGTLSCGSNAGTFGSGNVLTIGDNRYVRKAGDTMTGALVINVTGGNQNTVGLKVVNTMSGAIVHASNQLRSSGSLIVEGDGYIGTGLGTAMYIDSASRRVAIGSSDSSNAILDVTTGTNFLGLRVTKGSGGAHIAEFWANSVDVLAVGVSGIDVTGYATVTGTISGSLLTQNGAGTNYLLGSVAIGKTSLSAGQKLEVLGSISGSALKISNLISGSGGAVIKGSIAFRSLTGCTALQSDSNGLLSCNSNLTPFGSGNVLTIGNARYVSKQGDTMTGALVIQNGNTHSATATPLLNVRGTMSGRSLYITGTGGSALLMTNITTGRVGIGTSSPKALLGVAGTISGVTVIGSSKGAFGTTDTTLGTVAGVSTNSTPSFYGASQVAGGSSTPIFDINNFGSRRFALDAYGQIYLGDVSGGFPTFGTSRAALNFTNNLGDKQYLYNGGSSSRWGFGIQNWTFVQFMDPGNPGTGRFSWRNASTGADASTGGAEVMNLYTTGTLENTLNVATATGYVMRAAAGQTESLLVLKNSSNNTLSTMSQSGWLAIGKVTKAKTQIDVVGTISGSLLTQNGAGTNYFLGSVAVGKTSVSAGQKLEILGSISGSALKISNLISGSGGAVIKGSIAFRSLTGCTALQSDSNGLLSCNSNLTPFGTGQVITIGDTRYVKKQGDTMTGALTIQNGNTHSATATPLLNVRGTMSGRSLYITGTGGSALLMTNITTGRVGIGTSAPKAKLDVVGTISGSALVVNGASTLNGAVSINVGASAPGLAVQSTSAGVLARFGDFTQSTAKRMDITNNSIQIRDNTDESAAALFLNPGVAPVNVGRATNANVHSVALDVGGTISGALLTQNGAGTNYLLGSVAIGKTSLSAGQKLEILGSISGSALKISNLISGSGGAVIKGSIAFRSLTGCTALQSDNNGLLSCNSNLTPFGTGQVITIGDTRYVKKQGDTMTGALVIQNGNTHSATATALLNVRGTMSGRSLYITGTGNTALLMTNINTGRVGIGTANPKAMLDVVGTLSGSRLVVNGSGAITLGNGSGVVIRTIASNTLAYIDFRNSNNTSKLMVNKAGFLQANSGVTVVSNTSPNDFTFTIKRDAASAYGNGAILKFSDNSTTNAYIKWVSSSFAVNINDLEFHTNNGLTMSMPSGGGTTMYNPVQNSTDITVLKIASQTLYPGGGTHPYQATVKIDPITFAGTSPLTVTRAAQFYIRGAPIRGNNMTFDKSTAAQFDTGGGNYRGLIIRGGNSQSGGLLEFTNTGGTILSAFAASGGLALGGQYVKKTLVLEAYGTMSGSALKISNLISGSGGAVIKGSIAFRSLTGCTALQSDSNGLLSCNSNLTPFGTGQVITIGDTRYVKKQGDTMTGALTINVTGGNAATLGLKVINTMSGARLVATDRAAIGTSVSANDYEKLLVSGYENGGNGLQSIVQNTAATGAGNAVFAIYSMRTGTSPTTDGVFFGGKATAFAGYGIVNGITMRPGQSTQDLGLAAGNAVSGSAAGPALIIKPNTKMAIGDTAGWVTGDPSYAQVEIISTAIGAPTLLLKGAVGHATNLLEFRKYDNTYMGGMSQSGWLSLGRSSGLAKTAIDVIGTISGSQLTINGSITNTGSLTTRGTVTFRSLTGCTALQSNSSGVLSCNSNLTPFGSGNVITIGNARYVSKQGDTMTGALVIQNGNTHTATATPLLNVRGTMSGRSLWISGSGSSPLIMTNIGANRVGIGTSNPQYTLHVSGTDNPLQVDTATTTTAKFVSTGNSTTGRALLQIYRDNGGSQVGYDFGTNVDLGSDDFILRELPSGTTRMTIKKTTGNVLFDTDTLAVDASNNRVGIGTATPNSKLQVRNGVLQLTNTGNYGDVEPSGGEGFELGYDADGSAGSASGGPGTAVFQSYNRDGSAWRDLWMLANETTITAAGSVNALHVNSDGRIGIGGTLAPKAALDVIGTISGSLLTQNGAGTNYLLGSVAIGKTSVSAGQKLEILGSISGSALKISNLISGSGGAVIKGSIAFRSLTGCTALQSDSNGLLSCNSNLTPFGSGNVITIGNARYVKKQGDTMTGALVINVTGGNQNTLGLRIINTLSGAHLHAEQRLTSSGVLVVESGAYLKGSLVLSTDGSTTSNPRRVGMVNFTSGEAGRFEFGDPLNSLQAAHGGRVQIQSYWGMEIAGNRQSGTPLSFDTGRFSDTSTLTVTNTRSDSVALVLAGASSQSANYLNVTANGGADGGVFVISAAGNVGLGKASPSAKLDVVGTISGAGLVINGTSTFFGNAVPGADNKYDLGTNTARWRHLYLSGGTLNVGTSTNSGAISYRSNGFEGLMLYGKASSAQPSMFLSSGGLVGIGTVIPKTKLEVLGLISGSQLNISGNSAITGALLVKGNITTRGMLSGNLLSVSGNSLLTGAVMNVRGITTRGMLSGRMLTISGNANITGALLVKGNITTRGTFSGAGLVINGTSTFFGNVVPGADNKYDLGTNATRWRHLYLSGGTLNIGTSTSSGAISYQSAGFEGLKFFGKASAFVSPSMFISSGGLVGIGKSSDLKATLEVFGTMSGKNLYIAGSGGTTAGLMTDPRTGKIGIGTATPKDMLHIFGANRDSQIYFQTRTVGGGGGGAGSSGPNSPGTLADDSSFGTVTWTNTSNAASQNNTYSSLELSNGQDSHYLKATNFGFALPSNATVVGITVEVDKYATQADTTDARARIVKGGSIGATDKSQGSWSGTDTNTYTTYGGAADLWGDTWSYSDINASTFGFAMAAHFACVDICLGGAPNTFIDHIRVTVAYTTGGATPVYGDWVMGSDFDDSGNFKLLQSGATMRTVMEVASGGLIGIGTGTSLTAKMTIYTDNGLNQPGLIIQSDESTSTQDMFRIRTNYSTTNNLVYRITASGATYADAPYNSAGADYAEYFPSDPHASIEPGEAVCLDPTKANTVKRCDREADPNIMGIRSTKPSVVGNSVAGKVLDALGLPVPGYTLVGLIGQLEARAIVAGSASGSTLTGSMVIKPGDSLTSASKPGFLRKALPGESTVGVALTGLTAGEGEIRVLIARTNTSNLTAKIDAEVADHVAALKVDDKIKASLEQTLSESSFDQRIAAAVTTQMSALSPLQSRVASLEESLSTLRSQLLALSGSTFHGSSDMGHVTGDSLTLTGSLAANALSAEETLTVGRDARIGGDLYLEGALIMTGDVTFSGNVQTGKLKAASGSQIDGTLTVAGDLLVSRNLTFETGAVLSAKQLLLSGALVVRGPITIDGLATFLGDVDVKGELTVNGRQAGFAIIDKGQKEVTVRFEPPFKNAPVVTATSNAFALWRLKASSMTGFTLEIQTVATEQMKFAWQALTVEAPVTASGSFMAVPDGMTLFPLDAQGVPLSSSSIWNACIRHQQPMDPVTGQPFSCSRYTPDLYTWNHPDFPGMTFVWNDSYNPPLLVLPEGYSAQRMMQSADNSSSSSTGTGSSLSSSSESSSSSDSSSSDSSSSESSVSSESSSSSSEQSSSSDASSSSSSAQSSDSSSSDSSSSDSSSSEGSSSSQ